MRAVVQRVSRGWVRILRSEKWAGAHPVDGRGSGNGRDWRSAPAPRGHPAGTRPQGSHLTPPASHLSNVADIARGLVVLLGVGDEDTEDDASYIADKVLNVRIFPDNGGKFNHSVLEVQGELLVVSQFTLYGDCRKGRRPSFTDAALPETASHLYNLVVRHLAASGLKVETGQFQAMMEVGIINDGPVTILIDSKKLF